MLAWCTAIARHVRVSGAKQMSLLTKLLIAAAASSLAAPASAELIAHKDLSYEIAKAMAEGAIETCTKKGFFTSAVVVDRAGATLIALRGDNASPMTMENARRKAYTAMAFRQSTTDYAKKLNDGNLVVRQQITLPNIIAIPGGIPIKVGDDVIGGIGVSGSPGVDDDCVMGGFAKVDGQLK
jgi:uncharacterized protein GlcG (DUF336 family)